MAILKFLWITFVKKDIYRVHRFLRNMLGITHHFAITPIDKDTENDVVEFQLSDLNTASELKLTALP